MEEGGKCMEGVSVARLTFDDSMRSDEESALLAMRLVGG
jgi:hypothetical protein